MSQATDPAAAVSQSRTVALLVTTLGSIGLLLATYWSALFAEYGRADDYIYLYGVRTDSLDAGLGLVWLDAGRIVPALVSGWLLPQDGTLDDLVVPRLVAGLMMAAGAAVMAILALKLMGRRTPSTLVLSLVVAGVALSTTSAPSAVTWAVMAAQLIALPLALIAGMVVTESDRRWRWVVSVLLIVVATFSYQHFAPLAFFTALTCTAARWARGRRVSWWEPILVGATVVAALAGNYAFVLSRDGYAVSRLVGATMTERASWFVSEFLPRTVDFAVPWSGGSAVASAVVIGALLVSPMVLGVRWAALPLAVVTSWLSAAIIIVPGELWASYRLISAAQFVLWTGAACCAAVCLSGLRSAAWRRLGTGVCVVTVGYSLLMAHTRAVDYFAAPNIIDWQSAKCAVEQSGPIDQRQRVQLNSWVESTSPVISYDEYGMPASAAVFAMPFLVWLAEDAVNGAHEPNFDPALTTLVASDEEAAGALQVSNDICGRLSGSADSRR